MSRSLTVRLTLLFFVLLIINCLLSLYFLPVLFPIELTKHIILKALFLQIALGILLALIYQFFISRFSQTLKIITNFLFSLNSYSDIEDLKIPCTSYECQTLAETLIQLRNKWMEEKIESQNNEKKYKQILDAISDMILVKGEKSRIIWANRAFREYYGMSDEQLSDVVDASFNELEYTQQYVKDDAYVFSTGNILDIPEEPITRHNGEVRYFHTVKAPIRNDEGAVIQTIGVSRDITEVKKEISVKEKNNALLNQILSTIPYNIFWKDSELKYLGCNEAFARTVGFSHPNEVVGLTDDDISWFEHLTYVEDDKRILESAKSYINVEAEQELDSGKRQVFLISKVPLINSQNKVIGVLGIFTDITFQKQSELKLKDTNRILKEKEDNLKQTISKLQQAYDDIQNTQNQLYRSEQRSSFSVLASNIVHELNNTIGFVSSNLQTLLEYSRGFEKNFTLQESFQKAIDLENHLSENPKKILSQLVELQKQSRFMFIREDSQILLQESMEGVDRMTQFVNNLTLFTSSEAKASSQMLNINQVLKDAISVIKSRSKYICEIVTDFHEVDYIGGQKGLIAQAFFNIILNATQFKFNDDLIIKIETNQDEKNVYVLISDNGFGLTLEQITKVFDPFFTTKQDEGHVGLGLTIAENIIKDHHGSIKIKSELYKNTDVLISLPRHSEIN